MAITIYNMMVCELCNSKLDDKREIYSFPAFVANADDPVFKYNDKSYHMDCLNNEEGQRAVFLVDECYFYTSPLNRVCEAGGNIITNPDDYLFLPLLTSNKEEALYKFNFLTFDKKNIKNWNKRVEFLSIAEQFKKEGKWVDLSDFKFLDYLINSIKTSAYSYNGIDL